MVNLVLYKVTIRLWKLNCACAFLQNPAGILLRRPNVL